MDTRRRLLEAASEACAERGFDGATLQEVARRAGVTATALYNHFESREALLYEAGVAGLRRMTEAVRGAGHTSFADVARAYLRPEMSETRRLLAELHVASRRDPHLAEMLDAWHRSEAEALTAARGGRSYAIATVKALFLLLLGLCHLEDLEAVAADDDALVASVVRMAEALSR